MDPPGGTVLRLRLRDSSAGEETETGPWHLSVPTWVYLKAQLGCNEAHGDFCRRSAGDSSTRRRRADRAWHDWAALVLLDGGVVEADFQEQTPVLGSSCFDL